ncbi:MAG: DUF790 family protein [Magnetococcales bacterium]|nr:DUF790 family protein [Magnetococcales bacterium]
MLNRELLRFDRKAGRLIPRFIDPENAHLRAFAQDLALIYTAGEGQSREELAETVLPRINGYRSPLVARGLNKLLLDRCTFRESLDGLEEKRLATFTAAARLRHAPEMDDLERFRQAVAAEMQSRDPDQLALDLHADLPDRQPLTTFDPMEPEILLHSYNMALAQGPLQWAERLTIWVEDPDPGRQRTLLHKIKFFQLLASVTRDTKLTPGYRLELDGPLSLFDVQRKYGHKLAALLPAVSVLSRWRLQAILRIDGHPATLELNDASGLTPPPQNTTAYIPDEFTTFATKFAEEVHDWQLAAQPTLLELNRQELVMPDFTFQHPDGDQVHLELFHRWHAGQLPKRLRQLDTLPTPLPLVIGVDRGVAKKSEIQPLLEQSHWFQSHGLLFNQFPPVKRVVAALNAARR